MLARSSTLIELIEGLSPARRLPPDLRQKSLVMTPARPNDPIAAISTYWAQPRRPTNDEVLDVNRGGRGDGVPPGDGAAGVWRALCLRHRPWRVAKRLFS